MTNPRTADSSESEQRKAADGEDTRKRNSPEELEEGELIEEGGGFLTRFLRRRRVCGAVEPAPTIEPMRDGILRAFLRGAVDEGRERPPSPEYVPPCEVAVRVAGPATPATPGTPVTVFNLPYTATDTDIASLMERKGMLATNIELRMDKKRGHPSGVASLVLHLQAGVSIEAALETLKDCELSGRTLRFDVQTSHVVRSRYWGLDLGCKCSLCGQVGHRGPDCMHAPLVAPCSICAGADHECQACPHIVCYRCGVPGHHWRSCTSERKRGGVCSLCGGSAHTHSFCRYSAASSYDSPSVRAMFEGRDSVCSACGMGGHVMCAPVPVPYDRDIFCYNCGESGHCLDVDERRVRCVVPRMHAYCRFPSLATHVSSSYAADNQLYLALARSTSHHFEDLSALFPSLAFAEDPNARPPPPSSAMHPAPPPRPPPPPPPPPSWVQVDARYVLR